MPEPFDFWHFQIVLALKKKQQLIFVLIIFCDFSIWLSGEGSFGLHVYWNKKCVYSTRGIKHGFPYINIRKVSREAFFALGFQPSRGTLRMLMNNKIMVDRYYCINSTKTLQKRRNYWRTLFYSLITFSYANKMHDSG